MNSLPIFFGCFVSVLEATAATETASAEISTSSEVLASEVGTFVHEVAHVAQVLARGFVAKEVEAVDEVSHHIAVDAVGFTVLA